MAQYESDARTPKADWVNKLTDIFDIDSRALTVHDMILWKD